MKNKITYFTLVLFVLINSSSVFAAFEYIYMADADGHAKATFNWDDQPYLCLKLPHAEYSFTSAFWIDPDIISYSSGGNMSYDQEVTIALENWDTVKKSGNWHINALYLYPLTGISETGNTSFFVEPHLPEPASFILFGLGLAGVFVFMRKGNAD